MILTWRYMWLALNEPARHNFWLSTQGSSIHTQVYHVLDACQCNPTALYMQKYVPPILLLVNHTDHLR